MKHFRLMAGSTFLLFIIGLLSGSLMLELTKKILDRDVLAQSMLTAFVPHFSLGFLLAFCSIGAGGLLWAYSRGHAVYNAKIVFGVGLLISLISAAVGVGLKLLQLQQILHAFAFEDKLQNVSFSVEAMDYFSWGFGFVLFVNAVLIAILLWLPSKRQKAI